MFAAGLFLTLALAFAPDGGVATNPEPTNAAAKAASADDEVVCKTVEVTGSRFPKRDCRSRAEWKAQTAAAKEFVDKATSGFCTGSHCHQ